MCSDIVRLSTAFLSKFGSPSVWRPDLNRTHPVCAALIPQLLLHGRRVTTMCNGIHNFQFPARMPIVMSVLLLALIASAVPAAAAADRIAADNPPVRFYWRKAEGWFWCEPIPKPAQLERPQPAQPAPSPISRRTTAPAAFSAAWFRQNLPKYKDLAWDHPTLTNLRVFLWVQWLTLDRARQFADMSELATLGDPLLDALSQRPYATFAAHTLDRQAGAAQARLLNELAQRAGLVFFFHSACPACATQAPLVRTLAKQHRFSLIPVFIDGQDLPGHPFPAFKPDRGQAAHSRCRRCPPSISLRPTANLPTWAKGVTNTLKLTHCWSAPLGLESSSYENCPPCRARFTSNGWGDK